MKHKKKIFLYFIFLIIAFLYFIGWSLSAYIPLVEKLINENLKINVDVKKLAYKFPNKLSAKNIVIIDKKLGEINIAKLNLYINLIRLAKQRKIDMQCVYKIKVADTNYKYFKSPERERKFDLSEKSIPKIKIPLENLPAVVFDNCSLEMVLGKKAHKIGFSVKFSFLKQDIFLNSKIRIDDKSYIFLSGKYNQNNEKININLKTKRFIDISQYSHLLPQTNGLSNLEGRIWFDNKIYASLGDILEIDKKFENLSLNGKVLVDNLEINNSDRDVDIFGLKLSKEFRITNFKAGAFFVNNSLDLSVRHGFVNEMSVTGDLHWNSFFEMPTEILFNLSNIYLEKLNILPIKSNKTFIPMTVKGNLIQKKDGYNGLIEGGIYSAQIFEAMPYIVAPFEIEVESNSFNLENLKLDLKNIGELNLKVKMTDKDWAVSLKAKEDLVLTVFKK
ncbi:hypothetical protein ACFL5N_01195 [bacterium]